MKTKLFLLLLLVGGMTVSCSSDDDQPWVNVPQQTDFQFTDKWWYSIDHSTSDLHFHSDGTYESIYGASTISNGEWEWTDEDNGIVHVFNLTNNLADEYYLKVTELGANNLSIKVSFDNGATYTNTPSDFLDTND